MKHGKSLRGKEGEVALVKSYRNVEPTREALVAARCGCGYCLLVNGE